VKDLDHARLITSLAFAGDFPWIATERLQEVRTHGKIREEPAVKALTTILENVEHLDHIHDTVKALLGSVFDPYWSDHLGSPLTPLQREVLQTLAKKKEIWELDRVTKLIGSYSLPKTQNELTSFLASAPSSE
jgi:hypothetical protein